MHLACVHVCTLALNQHDAAHDTGEQRDVDDGNRDRRGPEAGPEGSHDDNREQERREGEEDVPDPCEKPVDEPPAIAAEKTQRHSDENGDSNDEERAEKRRARPVDEPRENVPAGGVGPEWMGPAWGSQRIRQIDLIRVVRREQRCKDRDENEHDDHGSRGDRHRGSVCMRDPPATVESRSRRRRRHQAPPRCRRTRGSIAT